MVGRVSYFKYKVLHQMDDYGGRIVYHPKPIPADDVFNLMRHSVAVLDIQHPTQIGLTIRSLETLATGCKLVTTNQSIQYYDLFDKDSVCIIDRENPVIPSAFFQMNENQCENDVIRKYSIDSWISHIFQKTSECYLNEAGIEKYGNI